MYDPDDELTFDVDTNDDDTEICLIVSSPSGRKITQHEFVMCLEQYLHEVTEAAIYKTQTGASNH